MDNHHLLALLDGRDSDTLKDRLKQHRKVHLVARDRASAYASAINEILPKCTQVADRFHLLHNLLAYPKDIFRAQMPTEIFIKNDFILDCAPPKLLCPRKPNDAKLASLKYDNTPPQNPDGTEIYYDNKRHDLNDAQYKAQKENRLKKQRLVRQIQSTWYAMRKPHPETIESYIELIQSKFPVVLQVKDAFDSFNAIIMGNDPSQLDKFLDKYAKSKISAFCNGIKKGYRPHQEGDIPECKF